MGTGSFSQYNSAAQRRPPVYPAVPCAVTQRRSTGLSSLPCCADSSQRKHSCPSARAPLRNATWLHSLNSSSELHLTWPSSLAQASRRPVEFLAIEGNTVRTPRATNRWSMLTSFGHPPSANGFGLAVCAGFDTSTSGLPRRLTDYSRRSSSVTL